jgi:hypothetical protein
MLNISDVFLCFHLGFIFAERINAPEKFESNKLENRESQCANGKIRKPSDLYGKNREIGK